MKEKKWPEVQFSSVIENLSVNNKKIPRANYNASGAYPIIDQGQEFVGGYTDDASKLITEGLPLIVFGDHTRVFKYLDCFFAPGADGIKVFKPKGVNPKWLFYISHALDFPNKGYARHYQHLLKAKLFLPSLPEQEKIVEEIERQLTRLDAGTEALKRVERNLKRYRAAVLKSACEGTLVPNEAELARQEHRDYETGEQLLQRILKHRRENWTGRGKYKEPVSPNTSELGKLPEGWCWASIDQTASKVRNGISIKPTETTGVPILRISAVRALSVNILDTRYLKGDISSFREYKLEKNDLLFTRYNGNPDFVGVCGIVPELSQNTVHPDKLIRCVIDSNLLSPHFVAIIANTGSSRKHMVKLIRTTAGQCGISGADVKTMPIPLPPLAEQERIVAEVERRLSIVDELEQLVKANLKRAANLKQAILKKAFAE